MTIYNNDTSATASRLVMLEAKLNSAAASCSLTDLSRQSLEKCPELRMKFVGDAWGHDFELMSTPSERLILSAGKDGVVGSADDLIVIDGRVYISVQSSFDIMLLAALPWVPAIIILVVVLAFLFRKFARKKGRAGIEREGCSA